MREALARARHAGRDRRRDDRDRAARALRAAGVDAVREGRGDVLQLRLPAQLLPPARGRCSTPPPGTLPEAEIHARLVEALGAVTEADLAPLRAAAAAGAPTYAQDDARARDAEPAARAARAGAAVPHAASCPTSCAQGAVVFGLAVAGGDAARPVARARRASPARRSRSRATLFERDPRRRVRRGVRGRRVGRGRARTRRRTASSTSRCPTCSTSSRAIVARPAPRSTPRSRSCSRPASAARSPRTRSFAIPTWRKKDGDGALRISPDDARALGVATGERVRLTTRRDSVVVAVEVSDVDAARPRLAAERPRRSATSGGDHRHRAERADVDRGSRSVRRHAVAQARAGAPRAHLGWV